MSESPKRHHLSRAISAKKTRACGAEPVAKGHRVGSSWEDLCKAEPEALPHLAASSATMRLDVVATDSPVFRGSSDHTMPIWCHPIFGVGRHPTTPLNCIHNSAHRMEQAKRLYQCASNRQSVLPIQRDDMHPVSARKVLVRLKDYVDPSLDTTYGAHGLHPYPAKFIPQIPADIISEHTNERHIVFDPFCGSGTTLAEAQRLGRQSVGCDSNPIAALISRAKTTPITRDHVAAGSALIELLQNKVAYTWLPHCPRPDDKRLDHWFQDHVTDELAYLKHTIASLEGAELRQLAFCVFSSIIVSVSNQESDTRYAAVQKHVPPGEVFGRFCSRFARALSMVPQASRGDTSRLTPRIFCADLRALGADALADNSVDLVVTSPPYANSYDYYLYHKWRMIWLGHDVRDVQGREIGSRHEHSSKRASIDVFEVKMRDALANVARALKPSKLAYFLVGDSVIAGELINSEESFARIAHGSGLRAVESISYPLEKITRSFREKVSDGCHGGSRAPGKQQRVLVFESVRAKSSVVSSRKAAKALPEHAEVELKGIVPQGSRVAVRSSDRDRHVHSLARYPSKFVPAIPAWAIETFSKPGDLVLDPFSGSGTTSVEAILAGRRAFASDISPFSCLATEAKTTFAAPELIEREALKLRIALANLPLVPRLQFDLDTFWFSAEHLSEFASIRQVIESEIDPSLRAFFLTCLAATIRKFGFQDEAQIKVKRDPKKVISGTPSPRQLLDGVLQRQVDRLISFNRLADVNCSSRVVRCSADSLASVAPMADLIVTSPPYINAMNYPMTHRYENILLGLMDPQAKREHEREYIGTERVSAKDYKVLKRVPTDWSAYAELSAALAEIWPREAKRGFIAYKYFVQMRQAFEEMKAILRPGGHVVLVAGRNNIRGVNLRTFEILCSFFNDLGFEAVTSFDYEIYKQALRITRHSTADVINYDGVAAFRRL